MHKHGAYGDLQALSLSRTGAGGQRLTSASPVLVYIVTFIMYQL